MKPYLLFFITVLFSTCHWAQTIEVTIDPGKEFQYINGFGASDAWRTQFVGSNWPDSKRNRIAELLFSQENDENGNPKGIGLSIWRFYISAGTTEQGDNSGIQNEWRRGESFIDEQGNYDWSKQAGQQWFLRKAKSHGVDKFLAFSIAAPTFWAENDKGWNTRTDGNLNLKKNDYRKYSQFLVEVLDHFKEEGLAFDYLSPINEPQWDWEKATQEGTPATNENIAELVNLLNQDLKKKSLDTRIVVPEAADLRFLDSDFGKPQRGNQIESFFGNPSDKTYLGDLENVDSTISGHSYFTTWPVDSLISIRQNLDNTLKANELGYWQSEFCILERNNDIGGGGERDLGMGTALYVARVIHADLTLANAKSWQWWTALTIADFKDGLIYLDTGDKKAMFDRDRLKQDGDFHDSKLLWALGNYSRFVRPGMQRVSAEISTDAPLRSQYEDFMISAYKNPGSDDLIAVAINYSDQPKQIELKVPNAVWYEAFETSRHKDLERIKIRSDSIEIPAKSIMTIKGQIQH